MYVSYRISVSYKRLFTSLPSSIPMVLPKCYGQICNSDRRILILFKDKKQNEKQSSFYYYQNTYEMIVQN